MNNYAYLKADSPFFPLFEPTGAVPIKNILLPSRADCEGGGGVQDVYMVELDRLEPDRLEKLLHLVHKMCDPDSSFEVARKEIMARGLPLRASHVRSVSSDVPFFL